MSGYMKQHKKSFLIHKLKATKCKIYRLFLMYICSLWLILPFVWLCTTCSNLKIPVGGLLLEKSLSLQTISLCSLLGNSFSGHIINVENKRQCHQHINDTKHFIIFSEMICINRKHTAFWYKEEEELPRL